MKNLLLITVMLLGSIANAQVGCNPIINESCNVAFDLSDDECIAAAEFAAENDRLLKEAIDDGGTATTSSTRKMELEGLSRSGIFVVITEAFYYETDGSKTFQGFNESYNFEGKVIIDKYDAYAETRGNNTNLGDLLDTDYKFWYDTAANRVRDLVSKL